MSTSAVPPRADVPRSEGLPQQPIGLESIKPSNIEELNALIADCDRGPSHVQLPTVASFAEQVSSCVDRCVRRIDDSEQDKIRAASQNCELGRSVTKVEQQILRHNTDQLKTKCFRMCAKTWADNLIQRS